MSHWDSGRVVAYFGGFGVSLSSIADKVRAGAAELAEPISLLQFPIQFSDVQITVGDFTTLGGFLIVAARFGWDIRRDRRRRKQQEIDE